MNDETSDEAIPIRVATRLRRRWWGLKEPVWWLEWQDRCDGNRWKPLDGCGVFTSHKNAKRARVEVVLEIDARIEADGQALVRDIEGMLHQEVT